MQEIINRLLQDLALNIINKGTYSATANSSVNGNGCFDFYLSRTEAGGYTFISDSPNGLYRCYTHPSRAMNTNRLLVDIRKLVDASFTNQPENFSQVKRIG